MLGATFADLRYRYRQFVIAVVGAGVVLGMALLLSGMAAGFRVEIDRTVGAVRADRWVMPATAQGRFTAVSLFPQADVAAVAHTPGVTAAAPLVVLPSQQVRIGNATHSVVVIGVAPGSLGDPKVSRGSGLTRSGQVVSDTLISAGVGSIATIDGRNFEVVGTVHDRSLLGGTAIMYVPIADAQQMALNGRPLVTAVAVQGTPRTAPSGLVVLTNGSVEQQTLALLSGGVASINNSRILMWGVAAIIVASLLYVTALQRRRDFAVLKALGSSTSALFVSVAVQSVAVTVAAAAFGAVVCNFMHGLFTQPIVIPTSAFLTLPLVAVVVGLLASLVALRSATRADPASAFGA
jgi:putative ABC transport system permease protein